MPPLAATSGQDRLFKFFNLDEKSLLLQRHGIASREERTSCRGGRRSYLLLCPVGYVSRLVQVHTA